MSKKEEKLTKMDVSDVKSVDGGCTIVATTDGFFVTGVAIDGAVGSAFCGTMWDAMALANEFQLTHVLPPVPGGPGAGGGGPAPVAGGLGAGGYGPDPVAGGYGGAAGAPPAI